MRSYVGQRGGLRRTAREARELYVMHVARAEERVDAGLATVEEIKGLLQERYDVTMGGLDILDIGTGQQLIQLTAFAQSNRVVGIDLDVVAAGFDLPSYWRMLRVNGARRTAKTLVRKAAAIDKRYAVALRRRLGPGGKPPRVLQMDVSAMDLADSSFDFAYCASVFQHLPDPGLALDEMARVLRPGGVGYLTLQLWTSETGSLDPRLGGDRSAIPLWAHLRPLQQHVVAGNAYLNRLRLGAWYTAFEAHWPGAVVDLGQPDRVRLEPDARALQAAGELGDFDLEELVTHDLRVSWQKPTTVAVTQPR